MSYQKENVEQRNTIAGLEKRIEHLQWIDGRSVKMVRDTDDQNAKLGRKLHDATVRGDHFEKEYALATEAKVLQNMAIDGLADVVAELQIEVANKTVGFDMVNRRDRLIRDLQVQVANAKRTTHNLRNIVRNRDEDIVHLVQDTTDRADKVFAMEQQAALDTIAINGLCDTIDGYKVRIEDAYRMGYEDATGEGQAELDRTRARVKCKLGRVQAAIDNVTY